MSDLERAVAVAPRVAWHLMEETHTDVVYATTLPDGPPLVLRGTAGLIFANATAGGTLAELVTRVGEAAGAEPAHIRDDVVGFVDELVSRGLLLLEG
jgi:hypothetical protein